jgi:hypothetical protein
MKDLAIERRIILKWLGLENVDRIFSAQDRSQW